MALNQKIATSVVCSALALLALVSNQAPELTTSHQGLAHILDAEQCRLAAYQCSAERWTIGAGHTQGVEQGDVITLSQAADFFIEDVKTAERVVAHHISQTPSQGEWDMMVSFVYNVGAGNFQHSTLLALFNQGQHAAACDEYLRWVYVNGRNCHDDSANCAGIVTRRQTERAICLHGWGA